ERPRRSQARAGAHDARPRSLRRRDPALPRGRRAGTRGSDRALRPRAGAARCRPAGGGAGRGRGRRRAGPGVRLAAPAARDRPARPRPQEARARGRGGGRSARSRRPVLVGDGRGLPERGRRSGRSTGGRADRARPRPRERTAPHAARRHPPGDRAGAGRRAALPRGARARPAEPGLDAQPRARPARDGPRGRGDEAVRGGGPDRPVARPRPPARGADREHADRRPGGRDARVPPRLHARRRDPRGLVARGRGRGPARRRARRAPGVAHARAAASAVGLAAPRARPPDVAGAASGSPPRGVI
ncbi:MAG: hypothetical protein AVDCRST_MAG85-4056, partial [uncultured Solirubrobacteraceae bacterium]